MWYTLCYLQLIYWKLRGQWSLLLLSWSPARGLQPPLICGQTCYIFIPCKISMYRYVCISINMYVVLQAIYCCHYNIIFEFCAEFCIIIDRQVCIQLWVIPFQVCWSGRLHASLWGGFSLLLRYFCHTLLPSVLSPGQCFAILPWCVKMFLTWTHFPLTARVLEGISQKCLCLRAEKGNNLHVLISRVATQNHGKSAALWVQVCSRYVPCCDYKKICSKLQLQTIFFPALISPNWPIPQRTACRW